MKTTRNKVLALAAAGSAAALLAGCGSAEGGDTTTTAQAEAQGSHGEASGAADCTVTAMLGLVPAPSEAPLQLLSVGDSASAGGAALPIPEMLQGGPQVIDQVSEELGVGPDDVDCFVEDRADEALFTAFTPAGGADLAQLVTAAAGEPADGVWTLGSGEDGAVDLGSTSAARPTGAPLHLGMIGDDLAMSGSSETLGAAMDGDTPVTGDRGIKTVAEALDAQDVFGAQLITGGAIGVDTASFPESFDVAGIGLSGSESDRRLVLVYHHGSDAGAQQNADALPAVLDGDPRLSDRLQVESVTADGDIVTAQLTLQGMDDLDVWMLPMTHSPLLSHQ